MPDLSRRTLSGAVLRYEESSGLREAGTFELEMSAESTITPAGIEPPVDSDGDGVPDALDNCPETPNGPDAGSCTAGDPGRLAGPCLLDGECGAGGFCSRTQEDGRDAGLGDACDPMVVPEPGDGPLLAGGLALLALLARASRAPRDRTCPRFSDGAAEKRRLLGKLRRDPSAAARQEVEAGA